MCPWERHFKVISNWKASSLPVVVAQPDKNWQPEPKNGCSALVLLDRRRLLGSYERTNHLEEKQWFSANSFAVMGIVYTWRISVSFVYFLTNFTLTNVRSEFLFKINKFSQFFVM